MKMEYQTYRKETDEQFVEYTTLLSIHLGRLGNYNPDWSLVDIIVYEAMLVLYRRYGNGEFYFQQERWEEYTRLSWYMIRRSMDKLERLGLIKVTRKGRKKMNYYEVSYERIKNNLCRIYDFSDLDSSDRKGFEEMMKRFFDYWAANDFYISDKTEMAEDEVSVDSRELYAISESDVNMYERKNGD